VSRRPLCDDQLRAGMTCERAARAWATLGRGAAAESSSPSKGATRSCRWRCLPLRLPLCRLAPHAPRRAPFRPRVHRTRAGPHPPRRRTSPRPDA
jgi:hypothetical protein